MKKSSSDSNPDAEGEVIEDRTRPLRYSVSLVSQGEHRFYTLTIPSDVLAQTSFVTTREEDPEQGFQRMLSRERAKQIADYIDEGLGTIPTSIVLSAQPEANLQYSRARKTIEFLPDRKAFLVIDGQHRVYGFSLAKTRLRVPVVIYNGLSKRDESRLFIDINTKQKPVPNELLLDIKKLAEYENDAERVFGEIFDYFHTEPASPLYGLTSPMSRTAGKISRVTLNAALKPLLPVFASSESDDIYKVLSEYIRAIKACLAEKRADDALTNPILIRSIMLLFPHIGSRVKDRGNDYSTDNFVEVLRPIFARVSRPALVKPSSVNVLFETLTKAAQKDFVL